MAQAKLLKQKHLCFPLEPGTLNIKTYSARWSSALRLDNYLTFRTGSATKQIVQERPPYQQGLLIRLFETDSW